MDFRLSGQAIYGSGDIVAGDFGRLEDFLNKSIPSGSYGDYVLQLSGAGGDAEEGVLLGEALRTAQISTLVGHDAACLGACALAFLGGTQTYVTGVGIGRVLDFGGTLGFRGVLAPAAQGAGPAGTTSIPVATLARYAEELRGIDLGRLARLADPTADQPGAAKQPRDILALSIKLRGFPVGTPADWSTNACIAGAPSICRHWTTPLTG